jgi:hypothetical protein
MEYNFTIPRLRIAETRRLKMRLKFTTGLFGWVFMFAAMPRVKQGSETNPINVAALQIRLFRFWKIKTR